MLAILEVAAIALVVEIRRSVEIVALLNLGVAAGLLCSVVRRISASWVSAALGTVLFLSTNLLPILLGEFLAQTATLPIILGTWLVMSKEPERLWLWAGLTLAISALTHLSALGILMASWASAWAIGVTVEQTRRRVLLVVAGAILASFLAAAWVTGEGLLRSVVPTFGWLGTVTHRHAFAVALFLLLWQPASRSAVQVKSAAGASAAVALFNPWLGGGATFDSLAARMGLMAVVLVPIAAIGAFETYRARGQHLRAAAIAAAAVLLGLLPQPVGTVPRGWKDARDVLAESLEQQQPELHRVGPQAAEHGIQFVARHFTGIPVASAESLEPSDEDLWLWLRMPADTPALETGYWLAPGWIQAPKSAVDQWFLTRNNRDRLSMISLNPQLRSLGFGASWLPAIVPEHPRPPSSAR